MTLFWIGLTLNCTITGLLLADDIRLRRRIYQQKVENAERAAQALGDGLVLVDGVTLPSPNATWKEKSETFIRVDKTEYVEIVLFLGRVLIDTDDCVFVGAGKPMKSTLQVKNYAAAVRSAYRSQIARKAIEGASS